MPMFDGLNYDCFVMELQLQHLVDSALLEDVEMRYGKVSMHDLYREFATLEAQGKLMALDMEERRWVFARDALPIELEDEPRSSWKLLTRVLISETHEESRIMSVRTIEWKYCTNLVVLNLDYLYGFSGVWNFKDLIRLRSLTVHTYERQFPASKWSIEGLEGLKSLTYFKVVDINFGHVGYGRAHVGQLPAALKVLEVDAPAVFERDILALCTNLVSLKLNIVKSADLDLRSCASLQKVKLAIIDPLEIFASKLSIEGLEGLKTLTYFKMVCGHPEVYVGQLPTALKVLKVKAPVVFERDFLALCTNLVSLKLTYVNTSDLDLRSCTSLQNVKLAFIMELEIVRLGPSLQSLVICDCSALVEGCGLDRLVGLLSLVLIDNPKLSKLPSLIGLKRLHTLECDPSEIDEVPGLDGLVGLESLSLSGCRRLSKLPSDLTGLQCLSLLRISCLGGITEIPNLSGLEQLEDIDASGNSELTSLQGLGDLPALTILNLSSCESLCRLSDMSKLTNLKALDLRDTGVEFHEEDIHMLEGLQALEPVLVTGNYGLDFKRHKILYLFYRGDVFGYFGWDTWKLWPWEEKDLDYHSVAGYLVGKGFGIRDVEPIWRLIPGPATRYVGNLVVWHKRLLSHD